MVVYSFFVQWDLQMLTPIPQRQTWFQAKIVCHPHRFQHTHALSMTAVPLYVPLYALPVTMSSSLSAGARSPVSSQGNPLFTAAGTSRLNKK